MGRTEYFTTRHVDGSDICTKVMIVPKDYDNFPFNIKQGGSYNIAPARVLGLDYPTYLRFLRESFPEAVTLVGKGHKYVVPHWKIGCKEVSTFVKLLNDKLTLAVMDKEAGDDSRA